MKLNNLKSQWLKYTALIILGFVVSCTTDSETIEISNLENSSLNNLEGDSIAIENPGFEDSSDGWDGDFAMSGDEHTGSSSAKISSSSRNLAQTVALQANTNYTLSAYVLDGGTIGVSGSGLNEESSGVYDNWTKVSVTFNSGSNTSITIFAEYYQEEGRFDDFELIEGSGGTSTPTPGYTNVPSKIEAEDYSDASEGRTQTTWDSGEGLNVGWIDEGEYLSYNISVPNADSYTLDFRVASRSNSTSFDIYANNTQVGSVSESSTGGWQNWTTTSTNVNLPSGNITLRLVATGGGWNINWFEVNTGDVETPIPPTPPTSGGGSAEEILGKFWKITLPVDEDGNGSSTSNSSYSGRNDDAFEPEPYGELDDVANDNNLNEWFWVDNGEVFFRAFAGGATTSGSGYPRSELRGLDTNLSDDNDFSMNNYQELDVTVRVVDVPANIPEVNMVQIHGPNDEPLRVEFKDNASDGLHLTVNESTTIKDVIDYEIGQRLKVNVVVDDGRIYVVLNNLDNGDSYNYDFESDDDEGYWKVGCYLQSSYVYCDFKGDTQYCEEGGNNENYNQTGTVAVSNLTLIRDGVRIH